METQTVKTKNGRFNFANIMIILFCCIVITSVIYVLLCVYNPNRNAPGALGSACMDIICMAILFIPVVSLAFKKEELGLTTKLFLGLMLGTKWALFFDFLTWSLDGALIYDGWTFAFTIASLCSGAILGGIFVCYLGSYMYDMYGLKNVFIRSKVCLIINIVSFALTITLGCSRYAFEFVDGHYTTGVLYDAITVLPVLTLIYMLGYAIRNVKSIGAGDVVTVAIYIITMIVGALIEAGYGVGATYVSVTVADVFIYVMLQNKFLEREKKQKEILEKKVEKWKEKSNTDEVTGFFNRHAYEDEMTLLEEEDDESIVYVSMDVNGLKDVNDTLGHDAGDELLVGACECMKTCLGPYGKLYRIGGDEFVALIHNGDVSMDDLMRDFEDEVGRWRGKRIDSLTISSGYVCRKETAGKTLHDMAVLADERMYESKRKFYQKKGVDRRGKRDAHVALTGLYTKILAINVSDDSFVIVNMNEEDQSVEKGFSKKLTQWFEGFGKSGGVHPDDLDEYNRMTGLEYIKNHFKGGSGSLRIFYRRRFADKYRKVMMEIIPSNEYSEENQKLFLYVKDIDEN